MRGKMRAMSMTRGYPTFSHHGLSPLLPVHGCGPLSSLSRTRPAMFFASRQAQRPAQDAR